MRENVYTEHDDTASSTTAVRDASSLFEAQHSHS
jgi:hypothetical protein